MEGGGYGIWMDRVEMGLGAWKVATYGQCGVEHSGHEWIDLS